MRESEAMYVEMKKTFFLIKGGKSLRLSRKLWDILSKMVTILTAAGSFLVSGFIVKRITLLVMMHVVLLSIVWFT